MAENATFTVTWCSPKYDHRGIVADVTIPEESIVSREAGSWVGVVDVGELFATGKVEIE